jgi:hypothetical protein
MHFCTNYVSRFLFITKCHYRYVMYLGNKIVQHGNQKEMYDLLQMIDINGYYSTDEN